MYRFNDKNFDRLSRNNSEFYDAESSASGWERLERRLDKELPIKKHDRRLYLFWLFLILILAGGFVFILERSPGTKSIHVSYNSDPNAESKDSSQTAASREDNLKPDSHVNSMDKPASDSNQQLEVTFMQNNEPSGKHNLAIVPVHKDKLSTIITRDDEIPRESDKVKMPDKKAKYSQAEIDDINKNDSFVTSIIHNNSHRLTTDKRMADLFPSKTPMVIDVIDNDEKESLKKIVGSDLDSFVRKSSINDSFITNRVAGVVNTKHSTRKIKDAPLSHWEFGILTGPDFSNVGFKYTYNTGINIGAMAGYRFTDRWAVNTGLTYTKKFYKVSSEDYYPPKHYWTQYVDLDYVKGNCSMFEIPVNIRYDVAQSNKNRYFASIGFTSYIMYNQAYTYYYWQNGVYKNRSWSTDSTFRHWMTTLSFSFGIERSLGHHLSIQAEPYFKVPLAGIGFGKIKLNSYGLYITLKYKPAGRSKNN